MDDKANLIGQIVKDNHGTINQYIGGHPQLLPNSIPSSQNFVGREDYLDELRESYGKGTRCFVLHGTGGVGKTALSLQFAGEIAGEYTAKIFVNLQGMSINSFSPRDAMLEIVRRFKPDISDNVDTPQLKNDFVQFVQTQPTLIVLDNACNESQIAPLINVKDVCLIVSTRNYIELAIGKTKRIGAMSQKDGEDLLILIAGRERLEGRAGELAMMAGYLPMALKPLAKLLKKRFKTITNVLNDYQDKKRRLEITDAEHDNLSVEASFALSYDVLPNNLQECWRRLAVFPSDFEKQAASMVFGTEFEDGWQILLQLHDYSLIEEASTSTEENPRFNLHDLSREFADKYLSDDERFNAQHRHAGYYRMILTDAINIEKSDRVNGFVNALRLIDDEWENIKAGQNWSGKQIEIEKSIAALSMDYAGLVTDMLSLRLTPREEISWFEPALAAARHLQDQHSESIFLLNIGKARLDLGEYEESAQYFEQSLSVAQTVKGNEGLRQKAAVLSNLGKFYGLDGNSQKSQRKSAKFSKKAFKICTQLQDKKGICISSNNLGACFQGYQERFVSLKKRIRRTRPKWWFQKSLEYSELAKAIADDIGIPEISGSSRSNIGRVFLELGRMFSKTEDFKYAKEVFKEALEIQKKIKNPFGIAVSLSNIGSAYIGLDEKGEACNVWKEALAIFETLESPFADEVRQWIKKNCRS